MEVNIGTRKTLHISVRKTAFLHSFSRWIFYKLFLRFVNLRPLPPPSPPDTQHNNAQQTITILSLSLSLSLKYSLHFWRYSYCQEILLLQLYNEPSSPSLVPKPRRDSNWFSPTDGSQSLRQKKNTTTTNEQVISERFWFVVWVMINLSLIGYIAALVTDSKFSHYSGKKSCRNTPPLKSRFVCCFSVSWSSGGGPVWREKARFRYTPVGHELAGRGSCLIKN